MRQSDPSIEFRCGVEAALSLIGGKWKLLLIWFVSEETRRFNEIRRQFPEISQKVLTEQLRELEDKGVVRREVFPEVPSRVEYSITAFGESLAPVMDALEAWGQQHRERLIELRQPAPTVARRKRPGSRD